MANKISVANVRVVPDFVNPLSRYADSRVLYYGNNQLLTFETYRKRVYPPNAADKFTVVTPGLEYRPDLLAKHHYGVVDFWWKILEANDIADVMDFKSGTNIRLPAEIY